MELDPISAVARAIETRLRTYFPEKKWDFRHVPAALTLAEFKSHVSRNPLLALAFRSLPPASNSGRIFQGDIELVLTIVVMNQNAGTGARFFGDKLGPGLFPSLATVIGALNGWTCKGVGTFFVGRSDQTYAEGWDSMNMALASVDITARIMFDDVLGEASKAPEFLTLLTNWDVRPADNEPDDDIVVRSNEETDNG